MREKSRAKRLVANTRFASDGKMSNIIKMVWSGVALQWTMLFTWYTAWQIQLDAIRNELCDFVARSSNAQRTMTSKLSRINNNYVGDFIAFRNK